MTTAQFVVEVHAGDSLAGVYLGGALVTSPRLALRWLRDQAEDLAVRLAPVVADAAAVPLSALCPVLLSRADAPVLLRAWAADDDRQANAMQRLAEGVEFTFIARDSAGWYKLTAKRLYIPAALHAPPTPPNT
ncbi:hypothetical protein ACFU6R_25485 [Streptomyces sp. NPDC057499]|uniref:hypothetical protein n=1 Tax=Streptomyces sp. NPDC057499 TaxID=3346150 RepID=UPI003684D1BB